MPRIGIVGRPNSGRTTLFNALTGLEAHTAPHPFSTTEANIGVAKIPDEQLERVAELEGAAKIVHASLELLDVPLVHGPSGGLAGEALGKLREMEALVIVLRAFTDPAIPDEESGTDPVAQAEELLLELTLADGEVFTRRAEKAAKEATADASHRREADTDAAAAEMLAEGAPMRTREWTDEERSYFRDLAPLSLKPAVWVVNVAEDDGDGEGVSVVVPEGDRVVALSAELEEEAVRLDPEERAELFEGLGLGEGALAKVVAASYEALGLLTFYTVNPTEAHAWSVPLGTTARRAAGKVHSDLERGFIRAEVAGIGEVIEAGGWDAAKAAGVVRVEGKDYVVGDGDVIQVRFSV